MSLNPFVRILAHVMALLPKALALSHLCSEGQLKALGVRGVALQLRSVSQRIAAQSPAALREPAPLMSTCTTPAEDPPDALSPEDCSAAPPAIQDAAHGY